MSFPRYPRYKHSGVDWLGEVPEHWGVVQLNRLIQPGRRITYGIVQPGERDETGRYMVRGQDYSFGWASPESVFRVSDQVEAPYRRARLVPGDLVLTIVGAGVGNTAVVPPWLDGANITQTTARIAVNPEKADSNYVNAVLQSAVGKRSVELYAKGAAQPGLNLEHVRVFLTPLPPPREQSNIAAFLDHETTKIDALIAEQQRLIDLLKEKRQAVISHAVTKGLNPNVRMKDSGIEWLGEVPEHWIVCLLKRAFRSVDYGISDSLEPDGAIPVLRMGNIENGRVVADDLKYTDAVDPALMLEPGDLLFNRTNSLDLIGKVGVFRGMEGMKVSFASYLVRLRTREDSLPDYFAYLLNTNGVLDLARASAFVAIGQCNLNPTRYGQAVVAIPPKREQVDIACYLDGETSKLDGLTSQAQSAIDLLQERRTALISAAVTGQIDVRGFQPAKPA